MKLFLSINVPLPIQKASFGTFGVKIGELFRSQLAFKDFKDPVFYYFERAGVQLPKNRLAITRTGYVGSKYASF